MPRRIVPVLAVLLQAGVAPADAKPLEFAVTYAPAITDTYTGRVYVMLSRNGRREPRTGPSWFRPEPFFAVDVVDWKPNEPLLVGADALAYPAPLAELSEEHWHVQAVMRRSLDSPKIGEGDGTAVSEVASVRIGGASPGLGLRIERFVETNADEDTDQVKIVRLRSERLSDFHGRDVFMQAAVVLPDGYEDDVRRRYPALYIIPGFGGSHWQGVMVARRTAGEHSADLVKIGLDPRCRTGHHVFADSANNGPWATALVEELIPHLEQRFRIVAAPTGRYLTGGSSGGWSSLWLQVTHPDFFGGTWSLVPDPVDFRAFQLVNLYAPGANMYRDRNGDRVPCARRQGRVTLWYDDFCAMEVVQGEGGQIYSFDAVFSPRGADGRPVPFFDRATGKVDPAVIKTWTKYDIRLLLETNWATLGPKLAGKLHIYAGEDDNFYLEDAAKLLKRSLENLGSDAVVEILPGRNHGTVMSGELLREIDRGVVERFQGGWVN